MELSVYYAGIVKPVKPNPKHPKHYLNQTRNRTNLKAQKGSV